MAETNDSFEDRVSTVAARIMEEGSSQPPAIAGALIGVVKAAKTVLSTSSRAAVSNEHLGDPHESGFSLADDVERLRDEIPDSVGHVPALAMLRDACDTVSAAADTERRLERPPPRDRGMTPE